jgi:aryl-alcohol dehydrogenase-like predicted oxidoreductase
MLTGKYRQGEKGRAEGFGGRVFQSENTEQRSRVLDTVLAVAGELGVSADQVAIAWAGTHGAIPLIGPRSLEQLTSNLAAIGVDLSPEQLDRLDAVSAIAPDGAARVSLPWASDAVPRVVA